MLWVLGIILIIINVAVYGLWIYLGCIRTSTLCGYTSGYKYYIYDEIDNNISIAT